MGAFPRFLALFATLYGAYGCLSPILPNVLAARGLSVEDIALVLAAASALRLVAGPLAGRLADRRGAARGVLAGAAAFAGLAVLAHLPAAGFWPLLAVSLTYALGTAPLAPLADALALAGARGGAAFPYGRVRAAGSAAFISASTAAGWLVGAAGLSSAVAVAGVLFLATAGTASAVPAAVAPRREGAGEEGVADLLRLPRFRRTVLAAALVIGAHAMHDTFAMILWRGAGIAPGAAGLLWSESVAAEVLVFLVAGPPLLARLGLAGGVGLAAAAGALRWTMMGATTALPWLVLAQALHGLSFALLHLACLGLIERETPAGLRATALTLYGTLGLGVAGVAATLAAGPLFSAYGGRAFWAMALVSLAALPAARGLRAPPGRAADAWLDDRAR